MNHILLSLEKRTSMKPIRSTRGEGRRDWIRIGKGLSPEGGGSENPRTMGDKRPVNVMAGSAWSECGEVIWRQAGRSSKGKGGDVGPREEVGGVHSSEEASVMERGAKGPWLVNVNSEAKDVRWLPGR